MNQTIKSIMLQEHGKIRSLLKETEIIIEKDLEKACEMFENIKWNIEKHFFVEEKIIFSIYNSGDGDMETQNNLLKDHKDIMFLIKTIEENFSKEIKPKILKLIETITAHANFEDQVFYPRLDEELDEEKKNLIISRCSELIKC